MRHGQGLLVGLLAGLLAGCTAAQSLRTTAWWERLRPWSGPGGPDVVQMDVALLERPAGDDYVNRELWTYADEQAVSLERKAVLEDNGFRIGQIGGITPARLQALLTSDRSCVNPRRIQLHAGDAKTLKIAQGVAQCRFHIYQDGSSLPVSLEQADCTLQVVPGLSPDGRTRLVFTPQVEHGETRMMPQPAADRSGWQIREHRSTEAYTPLTWEVTLASNEYVIVGARADRPGTLGHQYFIRDDEPVPVQRVLVIRTSRAVPAGNADAPSDPEESEPPLTRSPPLAVQAAAGPARGGRP
jgi:hypothetical protein